MKTEALPRVGVVDAISTGLSLAARRPWLLVLPVVSELLLWLAPQVSLQSLVQRFLAVWEALARASTVATNQPGDLEELISMGREAGMLFGNSYNVAEGLSGGWLGLPSVFTLSQVTRMTFVSDLVLAPLGLPMYAEHLSPPAWRGEAIQVPSLGLAVVGLIGFWLLGQFLVALYLRWAAMAWRGPKNANLWPGLKGLVRLAVRLALYSLVLGTIIMILRLPLAVTVALLFVSGSSALGFLMLLFSGVALWLTMWFLVSLFFVNEAIVLNRQPLVRAIVQSIALVHNNFWPTMGFALLVNLLIYGFRVVWEIMGRTPLGAGLAIVGNAYLAMSLLLSVFVFYDALSRRAVVRRMVTGKGQR